MTGDGWQPATGAGVAAAPAPDSDLTAVPPAIGAAVIGCGYWGPNLARNLS
jgi:hypothetical protein